MKSLGFFTQVIILSAMILSSMGQDQQIDRQTEHIQQFARTMSDFVPTQTFTFTIQAGEQESFLVWPPANVDKVRGVFYVDNSEDPESATGTGFFAGCQVNGIMKKTFNNQRLGVFNLQLQTKPSNIKLNFKSDTQPMTIYLSYELKQQPESANLDNQNQNVPTKQQEEAIQKKSKLQQITHKFQKVRISVQGQQASLRRILKIIGKHGRRLENEIKYSNTRITIQTSIVILSGLLGMWIIKRQMSSEYQLLV